MIFRRRRERADRELDAELRDHVDRHIADLIRSGIPEAEARRRALREFGGIELAKEECRDERGGRWLSEATDDLRYGARLLRKQPSATVAAVVTLAFGVGAATAVFGIVNATLLRGFPGDPQNRIVLLATVTPEGQRGVSYADLLDWSDATDVFSATAIYVDAPMTVAEPGLAPDRFNGTYASSAAFQILEERAIVGRSFQASDDRPGAAPVVVLSHGVWEGRYQSAPDTIGRTVTVNGVQTSVIGVMRPGFGFPQTSEVWAPLSMRPDTTTAPRDERRLGAIARLAPDRSVADATTALDAMASRLALAHPDTNADVRPLVRTVAQAHNAGYADVFLVVMVAVVLLLIIACANVSGLVLAHAMQRSHEIATRTALGATRARIARQHLAEGLLLSSTAAPFALMLGYAGLRAFDVAGSSLIKPYWITFAFDWRLVLFGGSASLAAGIALGIAPAIVVARAHTRTRTFADDRRLGQPRAVRRWGHAIVALQLALSMMLLASAGLLLRGVQKLLDADAVVPAESVSTIRFSLPPDRYRTGAARLAVTSQLIERVRAVPGVADAGVSSALPFTPIGVTSGTIAVTSDAAPPGRSTQVAAVTVTPSYFSAMGTPLLRGRTFDSREADLAEAIVSLRFAETYFAGRDPIGRQFEFSAAGGGADASPARLTIIGVAPDIRYRRVTDHEPVIYRAERGEPSAFGVLIVRGQGDVAPVMSTVKAAAAEIDPDLPFFGLLAMDRVRAQMRWQFPLFGSALAIFAGLALLIAGIGLYAIVSATVWAQSYELGVRRALGAQRAQIWWAVLRRSVPTVVVGLALGLGAVFLSAPVLRALLVRTSPSDLPTLGLVTAVLLTSTALAAGVPAWRATRLDPLTVLRQE